MALQVEQHEYSLKSLKSVMSSDKFVALNTKHRHTHTHRKFICRSQICQIKTAHVILMVSKTKQGDLQKQYTVLYSFQTSAGLVLAGIH